MTIRDSEVAELIKQLCMSIIKGVAVLKKYSKEMVDAAMEFENKLTEIGEVLNGEFDDRNPADVIVPKLKPTSDIVLPPIYALPSITEKALEFWKRNPNRLWTPKELAVAAGLSEDSMRTVMRENVDYKFETHPEGRGVFKRVKVEHTKIPQYICIYNDKFDEYPSLPSPEHQRLDSWAVDVVRFRGAISATMLKNTTKNKLYDVIKSMSVREKAIYRDADGSWNTIRQFADETVVEVEIENKKVKVSQGVYLAMQRLEALARQGRKTGKVKRNPRLKTFLGGPSGTVVMYDLFKK